jgi:hypothetical protein
VVLNFAHISGFIPEENLLAFLTRGRCARLEVTNVLFDYARDVTGQPRPRGWGGRQIMPAFSGQ